MSDEQAPDSPPRSATDDAFAAGLRGFGPTGIIAILVILFAGNYAYIPFGALMVLLWVRRSHTPWRAIGYVRPGSWILTVLAGITLGIAFKLLMKAVVMPLLGAEPVNHAFHYLSGNRAALPGALWTMIVSAGFGEETLFRGFMFERFGKLFGGKAWSKPLTVLLTATWFGLAHYSLQGLPGTEQGFIVGLVYGTIFAFTGRIWLLMVAHAAFDLTAVWMIYSNLETRFAHLVFK